MKKLFQIIVIIALIGISFFYRNKEYIKKIQISYVIKKNSKGVKQNQYKKGKKNIWKKEMPFLALNRFWALNYY